MTSFWASQLLEPKRNFRFLVRFLGLTDQGSFYASKCTRPELTIGKTEHKYLNHLYKFPARASWNDITMTFVDPADPDTIGELHSILEKSGYKIPGDAAMLASISKNQAVSHAGGSKGAPGGNISILVLDAQGNTDPSAVLENWDLKNAWVSVIKPSDLAYDNEELSTVELTIVYDWAEIKVNTNPNVIHSPVTSQRWSNNSLKSFYYL